MNNLNKSNFWDELSKQCPVVMTRFIKFLDEYEQKNNWTKMFKSNIKFHDIPVEMQTGIVIAFIMNITNQPADQLTNSKFYITEEFNRIETKLKKLN